MSMFLLQPGRHSTWTNDWSVLLSCDGCGESIPVERTDGKRMKSSDVMEALTDWAHDCAEVETR